MHVDSSGILTIKAIPSSRPAARLRLRAHVY